MTSLFYFIGDCILIFLIFGRFHFSKNGHLWTFCFISTMNYMSFETITHFLFSQNIGPSAAEDGPEFKRFQPPIWMVGSLDAFSSTPILTPYYAVDSLTYLYFLCHWGNLSPMENLENDGHHVSLKMPFLFI